MAPNDAVIRHGNQCPAWSGLAQLGPSSKETSRDACKQIAPQRYLFINPKHKHSTTAAVTAIIDDTVNIVRTAAYMLGSHCRNAAFCSSVILLGKMMLNCTLRSPLPPDLV